MRSSHFDYTYIYTSFNLLFLSFWKRPKMPTGLIYLIWKCSVVYWQSNEEQIFQSSDQMVAV